MTLAALLAAVGCSEGAELGRPPAVDDPMNPAVLIEGGTFRTGSEDWQAPAPAGSPYSKQDEDPQTWTVETFWLQGHEVTNAEYRRFDPAHDFEPGRARHPAVEVTWSEALAYAEWLGGNLPSEVEWEYAARGTTRRLYPWGDDEPSCERAHYAACEPPTTLPVMSRPAGATPAGVHDLAGNAWEWVRPVWFDAGRHPANPDSHRLKGGSFAHPAFFLRAAAVTNDYPLDYRWNNIGFRVAWPATSCGDSCVEN